MVLFSSEFYCNFYIGDFERLIVNLVKFLYFLGF